VGKPVMLGKKWFRTYFLPEIKAIAGERNWELFYRKEKNREGLLTGLLKTPWANGTPSLHSLKVGERNDKLGEKNGEETGEDPWEVKWRT